MLIRKYSNALLNLAIAALAALTLYQTSMLWFGGVPSFGGTLKRGQSADAERAAQALVSPYRVAINQSGENRMLLRYNALSASPARAAAEAAIEQALKRGEFVALVAPYDPSAAPCVVFEYAFQMPAELFANHYKQRSSLLTSKVKQFDSIAVIPNDDGLITIIFTDSAKTSAHSYKLDDKAAAARLSAAIAEEKADGLYYEYAQGENGTAIYTPRWVSLTLPYSPLAASNPFGEQTYANISQYVAPFFDGSSRRITPKSADGVFTFSTDSAVVRYYPSGALECYFSYQNFTDAELSTIDGCLAIALGVIDNDETISNELYISSARKTASGYRFTLDAAVNDFPLALSKELRTAADMSHIIEISVERESVKYRRYAVSFAPSQETSAAALTYESFATAFGVPDDEPLSALSLGYRVDGGDSPRLCWFAEAEGREFALSAE